MKKTKKEQKTYSPSWLPQHKKSIDKDFVDWFIGFSEGDGHFSVTNVVKKEIRSLPEDLQSEEKDIIYRHSFVINQKEGQILFKLRTTLGFGKVHKYVKKKKENIKEPVYYRYIVSDIEGIKRLISIFNGKLVLKKTQEKFKFWLETFNCRHSIVKTNSQVAFKKTSKDTYLNTITKENAWLSGFIDAEGCFCATRNTQLSSVRNRLVLRFIIDQKDEYETLCTIQKIFSHGRIDKRNDCSEMFRYCLDIFKNIFSIRAIDPQKQKAFTILFDYLTKYPLKTTKNINYIRFYKLWIRLNDNIDRKDLPKSLKRFQRLIKKLE